MIGKDYSWYAIYVIRHHEMRVNDWVRSLGVEVLFPTKNTRKVWSDTYESRFLPGERVSVGFGPLKGVAGVLQEFNAGKRLRVRIDIIGYSLLLSIPEDFLVKESAAQELSV